MQMLTSHIKVDDLNQEESENDGQYFSLYFPSFTWVLRDVNMDFKHLTPKSYLLNLLEDERDPKRYSLDEVGKRNEIKKCIKSFFGGDKNLECLSLQHPSKPGFGTSCADLVDKVTSRM